MFIYPADVVAGFCIVLVSFNFIITLPAQPQGTVSFSFLLSSFGNTSKTYISVIS